MRLATLAGRAVVLRGEEALDIADASQGRFGPDMLAVLDSWDEFRAWAEADGFAGAQARAYAEHELEAPVRWPRQLFAIGLNYKDHADEASLPYPEHLVVFTKFASSIAAPNASIALPSDDVDYETELVVVIGREGRDIAAADAWGHVAGLSVGQDYSERVVQRRGPAAQFSLGKSYEGFTPFGPAIVTVDEFADPSALPIRAVLEGEGLDEPITLQDGTSADLIFSIPQIIADLSEVVALYPGDVIFTGTPAGVGLARGILLRPGQTLTSTIDGIGSITNKFTKRA